jgi:hypothetical protein
MSPINSLFTFLGDNTGVFLLVFGIVSVVSLLIAIVMMLRLRAFTKPLGKLKKGEMGGAEHIPALIRAVDENKDALAKLASDIDAILEEGKVHLKHVGLVRYAAFSGIGGKQSYSLCILDSDRNGFLVSFLTSQNTTRSYAVSIVAGTPSRDLGDEEQRAYDEALGLRAAETA